MRLFAAVEPPGSSQEHLEAALRQVRDDRLRWVDANALHITIAFYGEMAPEQLPDLITRLTRAARRHVPMDLRVSGAGRFDGTVLWAGVRGDVEPLRRLAASAAAAGRRAGSAQSEARTFRPHLTVARSRAAGTDLRPYVAQLADYAGPQWLATHVSLIRSHLNAGVGRRARYETVATIPFGAQDIEGHST